MTAQGARRSRWGALVTLGSAVRTSMRPGSASLSQRVAAFPRMIRATMRGEYAGVRGSTLAGLLAGLLYVISPVDLLPEAVLPLLGLADDAMVLTWMAAALVTSTEDFLSWERATVTPRDWAGPQDAANAEWAHRPGAQTVRSRVVS